MEEMRNAYKILVEKPEGKKLFGRLRRRCEEKMTTELMEIGWEDMEWIHLSQGRDQWRVFVNTAMNLRVT
jgi:hypothetical protein